MTKCEEEVIATIGGATLSPAESMLVKEFCGKRLPPFAIVSILKADRAAAKLSALMDASGSANDEALWELAFELLATLKDPQKALDQARKSLDMDRAKSAAKGVDAAIKKLRVQHADNGVKPSGPGGGKPK